MKEVWKSIKKYQDKYEVSNLGNIRKSSTKKELKSFVTNSGNMDITLTSSKDGRRNHNLVHRLVAEAFIPNPKKFKYVSHKDKNKQNNQVDNLEWVKKPKYNNRDESTFNGAAKVPVSIVEISPRSKKKKIINSFESITELREHLDISHSTFYGYLKGFIKHIDVLPANQELHIGCA